MSKPSYFAYTKDFANMVCRRLERENKKKDKEINKLNEHITLIEQLWKDCINENDYLTNENNRLHSIIKEVREYIMSELIDEWDIRNNGCVSGSDLPVNAITPILEILDKENSNE